MYYYRIKGPGVFPKYILIKSNHWIVIGLTFFEGLAGGDWGRLGNVGDFGKYQRHSPVESHRNIE